MHKGTKFLVTAVSVLCCFPQVVLALEGDFSIKGYLKNATAVRASKNESSDILKCENIVQIEPHYSLGDNLDFHGVFRFFHDSVFDVENGGWAEDFRFKHEIRDMNNYTMSEPVREFYADIRIENFFIRLGKQQIAWGEAIGMKMLDVLNPQDYRELNQLDFEDSRIPMWSLNIKYFPPVMGSYLQLIVNPDVRPAYIPPAGHPFSPQPVELFQRFIDEGSLHLDNSPTRGKRIPRKISNMEIGLKWYQNLSNIEYGINYFYHFSDTAGLYPGVPVFNSDSSMNYVLKYHRYHTLGGSFTKVFESLFGMEGVVLRGEVALHLNDRVASAYTTLFNDPANPFGIEMDKTDTFNYMIALEKFFFTDYYFSFQFFQFITLDYKDSYLDFPTIRDVDYTKMELVASTLDEVENVFTLFVSTDYFQERVLPDILWVYSDDGAHWIRGRCRLKYSDHWWFSFGANLYYGSDDTGIGQYHNVDNLFMEVKFEF